ncbi:hypothetical protein PMAYCL1PPCAC_20653, partial [Pristionchus mayeri]
LRMRILATFLLLLLYKRIACMPDSMCFVPDSRPNARILLERSEKETERACQLACGDNTRCSSILSFAPVCVQLGGEHSTATCTAPITIKKETT